MLRAARLPSLAIRTLGIAVLVFLLFLPFAGRFLYHEDQLERADLILVLAGARVERWLEAVDLYREGWAPRIVLSPGPVTRLEAELTARGVSLPREGELARDAVVALGVPAGAVIVLPGGVDNTAHEAAVLRQMLSPPQPTRLIVVTSKYHTRRAGFAFRRELADLPVQVIVRASRYDESEPARWWRRRADIRTIVSELPKLAVYLAGARE